MTDEEKHAFCKQRTGFCATFVSPVLYEAAEKAGYDMRWYVINKPIPTGSWGRKTPRDICGGKDARCLAGLGGKCVACDNIE